jgi:hypothetical protein
MTIKSKEHIEFLLWIHYVHAYLDAFAGENAICAESASSGRL